MEYIRQYIISIVAVAVLTSILLKLLQPKTTAYKLVKLMAGIIMILVMFSPLTDISFRDYLSYYEVIQDEAAASKEYGEYVSQSALQQSIKEKTEAYILDKAVLLGADIHVEVTCDTSTSPVPVSAELSGNVSPYIRQQLQMIICRDIGIPEEQIVWT